uniref:HNH endonuclease family protein n=1 Tax=Rhodococcus sp. R1101 TaxID=1170698 RepID=UPI000474DE7E
FVLSSEEIKETGDRLQGEIYKVAPVRKYVLLRLDELLSNASGVSYDHPRISVEHVLPQNPKVGSDWMKWFKAAEREFWTHRLGNLVLLNRTKNASAGNYDFDRKKTQYFTAKYGVASFAITTQVLQQKKWTVDVLEERQKELVGMLTQEWKLEGGLW